MGKYTTLELDLQFRTLLPEGVRLAIKACLGEIPAKEVPAYIQNNFPLFKTECWKGMLTRHSPYIKTPSSSFDGTRLEVLTSFKAYDDEITHFLEFISHNVKSFERARCRIWTCEVGEANAIPVTFPFDARDIAAIDSF